MLEYLRFAKGIIIDMVDSKGNTPLHYAVEDGREHTIMQILEMCPNADIKNNKGRKPFERINQKVANVYRLKLKEFVSRKRRKNSQDTTNTQSTPKTNIVLDLMPLTPQKALASPQSTDAMTYRPKHEVLTLGMIDSLLQESQSDKYLASQESNREEKSQKAL